MSLPGPPPAGTQQEKEARDIMKEVLLRADTPLLRLDMDKPSLMLDTIYFTNSILIVY